MSSDFAQQTLDEIDAARRATRRQQPKVWIALAAFSVVTAIAAPMYVTGPWDEFTPMFGGTVNVVHPTLIQTYWLIALPAVYLGYGAYLTWVANHVGVREDIALPVITGLVTYGIVVVVTVLFPESLATAFGGGLTMRGLLPLFVPPVALFVWGVLARNAALLATSVVALAAALVSNLYNVENLLQPRGWDIPPEHALTVNAAFTALVLFVCSLIVGVVEIRRGRK